MNSTNLNIRTDKACQRTGWTALCWTRLKHDNRNKFFLRTAIRKRGIPFDLVLDVPNETTFSAIEEGKRRIKDLDSASKMSKGIYSLNCRDEIMSKLEECYEIKLGNRYIKEEMMHKLHQEIIKSVYTTV